VGARFTVSFAYNYRFPFRAGWLPPPPGAAANATADPRLLPLGAEPLPNATANASCPGNSSGAVVEVFMSQAPSGQLDGSFRLAAGGYCDAATINIRGSQDEAEDAIRSLPGLAGARLTPAERARACARALGRRRR
jgi:hypothetical protein